MAFTLGWNLLYLVFSVFLIGFNKGIALGYDRFVVFYTTKFKLHNNHYFKVDKNNRDRMILSTRFFSICFGLFIILFWYVSFY